MTQLDVSVRRTPTAPPARPTRRSLLRRGVSVVAVLVAGFLVSPVLTAALMSFSADASLTFPPSALSTEWYGVAFGNELFVEGLVNSTWAAIGATVLAAVVGTTAAIGLRGAQFTGVRLVESLLLAPVVLPAVIIGLAMLRGLALTGYGASLVAASIGHGVVLTPYVAQLVSAGLARNDPALEAASRSLGAGPGRTLLRITLPLVRAPVLTGSALVFLLSFDNVALSLFLARGDTLPLRLMQHVLFYADPSVPAISLVLLLVPLVVIVLYAVSYGWRNPTGLLGPARTTDR